MIWRKLMGHTYECPATITAVALGVGAAGSLAAGGAAISNAVTASSLAGQASSEAGTTYGEQQGFAQQLASLIANPNSVTQLPGYQFQLGQGSEAVAQNMAASGFAGSGREAEALTQYGQGLAGNFYTTQADLLASLSGLTSASSPSQLTSSATSATNSSFNNWMSVLGQLGIAGGLFGGGMNLTNPSGANTGYNGTTTVQMNPGQYVPVMPGGTNA